MISLIIKQGWKGDISKLNGFWDTQGLTVAYGSGRMGPSKMHILH